MRIIDLLLDRLSETRLFEMAFERKKAVDKAISITNQLSRHMIKLIMYDQCQETNHWCTEVDSWLHDIQDTTLKASQRPLPYRDLMYLLYECPLEHISEVQKKMNRIHKQYLSHKIVEPDAGVVHKRLMDIYSQVCKDISEEKFETIADYLSR